MSTPGAPEATGTAGSGVQLTSEEAELVQAEASYAAGILDEPHRSLAARLAEEARSRSVGAPLVGTLSRVVTASLQGGRARSLYLAEGERVLLGLLRKTPAGQALQAQLDDVNAALRTLAGQTLEEARVAMRTPGVYTLAIEAGGVTLSLVFDPSGVSMTSLAT